MKLTKKILKEHGIYNSFNLAEKAGNKIFLSYIPADNGRLTTRYAYWKFIHFVENGYRHHDFNVTHREAKEPVLQQAIDLVKKKYNIDIADKDVFGGYHPMGTLKKLERLITEGING